MHQLKQPPIDPLCPLYQPRPRPIQQRIVNHADMTSADRPQTPPPLTIEEDLLIRKIPRTTPRDDDEIGIECLDFWQRNFAA